MRPIPLLILALALLAGCDDLPSSGGNTGAYWYMRSWRGMKDLTPEDKKYLKAQEERLRYYIEKEKKSDTTNQRITDDENHGPALSKR